MQILITSGGTTENIDHVRGITNFATGQLGKILAEQFLTNQHQVTLLAGLTAVLPEPHPNLTIIRISDVSDLVEKINQLVPLSDVCIHTMAVSDYTPVYMTDLDTVQQTNDIENFLSKHNTEHKITSKAEYQVLFLKKTPKIIKMIKPLNPAIILVGFKLLVNVSETHLIEVARQSLLTNQADYILANDLAAISDQIHRGLLINQDEIQIRDTKSAIAELIVTKIEETYDKNHNCCDR